MKKHESIMNRVRFIEEKYGIKYAKTDGRLYRTLKIIYTLVWAYTIGINLLFLAGEMLMYAGTEKFKSVVIPVINISSCTVVLIAGFVLLCTRLKLIGGIASFVPLIFQVLAFGQMMTDDLGYMGFKAAFYWRHFVPAVVMAALLVWMTVIAVRATMKTDSQYKRIVGNIYQQYHVGIGQDGDTAGITDEQWDEFLKNYDPRDYKRQFVNDNSDIPAETDSQQTADE